MKSKAIILIQAMGIKSMPWNNAKAQSDGNDPSNSAIPVEKPIQKKGKYNKPVEKIQNVSVISMGGVFGAWDMEQITVNEQVTNVITASEPIRFVDISTDKIASDQPINNTIRLKPKDPGH